MLLLLFALPPTLSQFLHVLCICTLLLKKTKHPPGGVRLLKGRMKEESWQPEGSHACSTPGYVLVHRVGASAVLESPALARQRTAAAATIEPLG